jgi:hypothetical protein
MPESLSKYKKKYKITIFGKYISKPKMAEIVEIRKIF